MSETYQGYIYSLQEDIRQLLQKVDDLETELTVLKKTRMHEHNVMSTYSTPKDEKTPPEMRDEIKAGKVRISQAVRMFLTNFDVDGKPLTPEAEQLMKKYDMDGWIDEWTKSKAATKKPAGARITKRK